MKATFEVWERLIRRVSGAFLLRAVLPWALVALIYLGLRQFATADGQRLVIGFIDVSDEYPTLAWLSLVGWIYLAALLSDGFASRLVSKYRGEAAAGEYVPSDDDLPSEIRSWWDAAKLTSVTDDDRREALSAKTDEKLAATLSYANLAAALFVSTWPIVLSVPKHPYDLDSSLAVTLLLTLLTAASCYLAWRDLENLIALDGIRRGLGAPLSGEEETRGIFPLRVHLIRRPLATAILALMLPCYLVLALDLLNMWTRTKTAETAKREEEKDDIEHLTIIAVNDIYRLEGVGAGERGGLPRLRTLRKQLSGGGRPVILTHAGDFLAPSLPSQIYKGWQMVDVMNRLDGNEKQYDENMFVVFGNHEFDDSKCNGAAPVLADRVKKSQFTWLNSNLDFSGCGPLDEISGAANVKNDVVVSIGKIKVGLFGIGLTPDRMEELNSGIKKPRKSPPDYPASGPEAAAAARSIASLKAQGAQYIVAVTHLPREKDQELLDQLGTSGLDLIVGGHDHDCMELKAKLGNALGFKADSDARTAWRIDLDFLPSGTVTTNARLIALDQSIPPDPDVLKSSIQWTSRAELRICEKRGEANNPACLDERLGRTQAPIELEESVNRGRETGFGDWLADLVRTKTGADVALINSGSLGLNDTLAANSDLRLRQIVEIFRYDGVIATRKFSTRKVCDALRHGFSTPGSGAWPHISGAKVEITGRSEMGNIVNPIGLDCDSEDREVTVAGLPFLLCGNDGYKSFERAGDTNCVNDLEQAGKANGRLSEIAAAAIRSAGDTGINPRPDPDKRIILSAGQPGAPVCTGRVLAQTQYR